MDFREFPVDVVVIGGCGRVGLPLGIAFAARGLRTRLVDINAAAVASVDRGVMPFAEEGTDEPLRAAVDSGLLAATTDVTVVSAAEHIVLTIGTPIDEYGTPAYSQVTDCVEGVLPHLQEGQLLVLRSTVHPGSTEALEHLVGSLGVAVAYCPERIAEGRSMTELFELPQLVGATDPGAGDRAAALFGRLTPEIIRLTPREAEFGKLLANTWRYITFAAANEFWTLAHAQGLDYQRIRAAVMHRYPRAVDLPRAGFAAGPCLRKDTLQLSATGHTPLGRTAVQVNEDLPGYVVARLRERYDLAGMSVGILGMAFKPESDDPRDSLSYKLRKLLRLHAAQVLCTDPYVRDDRLHPLDFTLDKSDLLVVATPHLAYRDLATALPVVDLWGALGGSATNIITL